VPRIRHSAAKSKEGSNATSSHSTLKRAQNAFAFLHLSARLDHRLMLFLAATGLSLLAGPQFLSACQKLLAAHSERAFCIAAPILASVCSMDAVFSQTSDAYYIIKKTLCILFADICNVIFN